MFVGLDDDLGDPTDASWARDQIQGAGTAMVAYNEVKAGHSTFMIGKDMSYFSKVLDLVKQHS